jgi:hypothetical protein
MPIHPLHGVRFEYVVRLNGLKHRLRVCAISSTADAAQ